MSQQRIVEFLTYGGIGGTQRMVLEFLRRASRKQFHISVCVLLERNWVNEEAAELGIDNTSLNMRGYGDLAAWARLYRWVRGNDVDLIRTYGLKAHLIGRIVGKIAGIPVNITSVRSTDPWRRWHHVALDRLTSGLSDLYIANSEAGADITHTRERIPRAKILTIPNGIDLERFSGSIAPARLKALRQEFGIADDERMIGMVANFRKMKGHATLIQALPQILTHCPDTRCVLIGEPFVNEPAYHQQVVELVRQRGLTDRVVFTGPRNDMPALLALLDVVALPSWWEGVPASVLEAMAMSRPVVASAVGGTPEIVEHNHTGLLIPPKDSVQLAEAIVALLQSPALAARLGLAGQRLVRRRFSLDAMVSATERIYDHLISTYKKRV